MKNDNIKYISILLISVIVSSLVSVAASGHLFDSNEVVYDNTSSGMSSSNVKDAVDELYAAASDYSNLSSRVTTLEGYYENNPTSAFDGHDLEIAKYDTLTHNDAFVDFWRDGKNRGGVGVSGTTGNMTLLAKNENSQFGTGTLDLRATNINIGSNATNVKINNTNIKSLIKLKRVQILTSNLTAGMDLSPYVTPDAGYTFLCWQVEATTDWWTSMFPIYVSGPHTLSGNPYWGGTLSTSNSKNAVSFYYFEILNV